jgi:hypothetical protein
MGQKPGLYHLQVGDPKRADIVNQFAKGWFQTAPAVKEVFAIVPPQSMAQRYDAYKARISQQTGGNPNELRRFHGTKIDCNFYQTHQLCASATCPVCNICHTGFLMKFACTGLYGAGLYFGKHSEKSHQYNAACEQVVNGQKLRCMFICRVTCGNEETLGAYNIGLTGPSPGYHCVHGQHNQYDEYIVYNEQACIPSYLIIYYA